MKTVTDHALNLLATDSMNSQEKLSTEKLPDSWVLAIFKKFHLRYPHKWASAITGIEAEMVKEWGCVLSGLTGNDIKRGLDSWLEEWPPSAPEFLAACKGIRKNEYGLNYIPQYYRQPCKEKLIESDAHKKNRKEKSREYLKKMRDLI